MFILFLLLINSECLAQSPDKEKINDLFQNQQFEDAIDYLKPFYLRDSGNLQILNSLGYAFYMNDNKDEARIYFQKIFDIDSNNISANQYLTNIEISDRDFDAAKTFARRLIHINPSRSSYYRVLAGIYKKNREEDSALFRADQISTVDLEDSQVSNLVDERAIKDLPLITRNPYELVLLSPGTSQTNSRLGGITVNGARERNNNFLLDGVDNNDTSVPGGIVSVLGADPESTQEFRVITNNFNAEYGRNTGAIIDVVTKSGTNQFHGDAYEFGRWNAFGGARDWFNRSSEGPQDPYIRHQFGFSIGGPIRKDKTFFFFNDEMDRFITTLTGTAVVPTAAFKTGVFNFTYIDPNTLGSTTIPVDLTPSSPTNIYGLPLDPTVQKILALYPNAPQSADGVSGTIHYPSSSRDSSYQTVVKIDHHFTERETFSVRYGYDHQTDPNPSHDDILPGNLGASSLKDLTQGLSASLTSSLTPSLLNNFTFGWNKIYASFKCTGLNVLDSVSPLDQFGNGIDYAMDPFTSFGCISLASDHQVRTTGTTSYTDAMSSGTRGSHFQVWR